MIYSYIFVFICVFSSLINTENNIHTSLLSLSWAPTAGESGSFFLVLYGTTGLTHFPRACLPVRPHRGIP
jgi:hypothetical protein